MSSRSTTGHQLINLQSLRDALVTAGLSNDTVASLCAATTNTLEQINHGDLPRWLAALDELSAAATTFTRLAPSPMTTSATADRVIKKSLDTDTVAIDISHASELKASADIRQALEKLRPWRKGPYRIAGTDIDTEWRSDWKWQRLAPHISPLAGKKVLDVGCGNGYHGWRMRGAGAELVLGIDPSPLFLVQFCALQQFMADPGFHLLPLKMEAMPEHLAVFDSVFSMGVLYHRRDHQAHLQELQGAMKPGAELVLETLITPADGKQLITPANSQPQADGTVRPVTNGRYARMRNVWALPSAELLIDWATDAGFTNIRIVDVNRTSTSEQRTTEWMPFESLSEALDPTNPDNTIEGWPAPSRALLIANKAA